MKLICIKDNPDFTKGEILDAILLSDGYIRSLYKIGNFLIYVDDSYDFLMPLKEHRLNILSEI